MCALVIACAIVTSDMLVCLLAAQALFMLNESLGLTGELTLFSLLNTLTHFMLPVALKLRQQLTDFMAEYG